MDRFGNPKTNIMFPNLAVGYKVTDVVDPSTVVIHLSHPVSSFLYNISIIFPFSKSGRCLLDDIRELLRITSKSDRIFNDVSELLAVAK